MNDAPPLSAYLENCLYFTANTLARAVGRLAEEAFAPVGLSPAHAFLLMLVLDRPDIPQKELAAALHLAPSTVTRFVDSLAGRGLLTRRSEGKLALVSPTQQGRDLAGPIADAWKRLHRRYSDILGEQAGNELARETARAGRLLGGEE